MFMRGSLHEHYKSDRQVFTLYGTISADSLTRYRRIFTSRNVSKLLR
jgi:hypothetical protein